MAASSHLIRRNSVYYFRRKIPHDLRAAVGKEEIRKSLATDDMQKARAAAALESAKWDKEFARLRHERFAQRRDARAAASGMQLPELFEAWQAVRERPRTTVYDFSKAMRRFTALYPALRVSAIEPKHLQNYKNALMDEGVTPGTVRKQFGALSAMLELAVTQGLLPDNPARGLRLAVSAGQAQKKLPFSRAELSAVFSTPVYHAGERPQGGAGAAAYWLPLLALYTGARLGELGALRAADVRESDGIKYLDLPTEHARSRNARRRMPVHGDLVRLGFLQFVEMQRRAGEAALFEALRADNKGKLTGNWSKWFARYLRAAANIQDRRKSFDSFRPSFIEACDRARLDANLQVALIGRGSQAEAQAIPLPDLAAAIQALRFDIG